MEKKGTVIAIAAFSATERHGESAQIDLEVRDLIEVHQKENADWWYGINVRSGQTGWFPASYVESTQTIVQRFKRPEPIVEKSIKPKAQFDTKPPISPKPKPLIGGSTNKPSPPPKPTTSANSTRNIVPKQTILSNRPKVTPSAFASKAQMVESILANQNKRPSLVVEEREQIVISPNLATLNGAHHSSLHNGNEQKLIFNFNDLLRPPTTSSSEPEERSDDDESQVGENDHEEQYAAVLSNFVATRPDQLSIKIGDVIRVHDKSRTGWWRGSVVHGGDHQRVGSFPESAVKLLGKEYTEVLNFSSQENGRSRSDSAVKKSTSMRWILDAPIKVIERVATTVSEASHSVMRPSAASPPAHSSPKEKTPRPSSVFYAIGVSNSLTTDDTDAQYYSDNSFESDDSDYGTDKIR